MPLIPTPRLILLAIAPVLLGAAMVVEPALGGPLLLLDGAIALLALIDAWLARGRLVRVEREPPRILSVGRANPVRLRLRSLARRALVVTVTDDRSEHLFAEGLPARVELAPEGTALVTYDLRPARRGAATLGDHHVRYPSPLGLWQRQLRLPAQASLRIYPDVAAVRAYELLARQSRESLLVRAAKIRGGESEFERLRDYGRDDDFRHIDWKATARRDRLIVRSYQQERNQTVVCLLDCGRLMTARNEGLAQLDHALNTTLMMAHVAARAGDQIGLLAFDSQVRTYLAPVGGRQAARRIVQATYDLQPALVETDFEGAFAQLTRRLRKRALVVLFTQLIDDLAARTVLRLTRSLLPRHLPLCVLFRDVDLERLAEPPDLASPQAPKALLYEAAAAAESLTWRDRVVRDLKSAGALVLHVHPKQATPAVISRYLEVKAQHLL